jgi:ADP-heptose:LPS heptosyltransferase
MDKICIVYTHSKVGDLIWQLPYIESISRFHNTKIDLITRKETQAKSILGDLNYIHKVEYNAFRKGILYWLDVLKLFIFFIKNKFSHAYILDKVNKPAIAAKFAGIKNIIGPGIGKQKDWLTISKFLSESDKKLNYSEQSQKLLKLNNIPIKNIYPNLDIKLNNSNINLDIKKLEGKIISFGIDSGENFKMWYEECFVELAEKLYKEKLFNYIFLICSKVNQSMAQKIINNSKKKYFIDCSNYNLINVMAALKKSSFFVGNNAGPLNISAAMHIDSFGLISNSPVSELKYSKIITITPDNYKDNVWNRNREGMKNLKVDKVYNFIISYVKNKK